MRQQLKIIFSLLAGREKRRLAYLCSAMIIMAVVETTGIASIMPFMAVLTNADVILANR